MAVVTFEEEEYYAAFLRVESGDKYALGKRLVLLFCNDHEAPSEEETRLAESLGRLVDNPNELEELRQLVIEAYPGDHPTNEWRARAERLDAWRKNES